MAAMVGIMPGMLTRKQLDIKEIKESTMIEITITKDEFGDLNPYSTQVNGLNTDKMLELQTLLNQRVFQAPLPQPAGLKIEANEEQIRNFLNTAHKLFSARIPAIKFVRFLTGCPLKEAKDLVDSCSIVYDNRPWPEGGNDW